MRICFAVVLSYLHADFEPRCSHQCHVGVSNKGHSSTAMGLSNHSKWVLNEAFLMTWCHAEVHVEVSCELLFSLNVMDNHQCVK